MQGSEISSFLSVGFFWGGLLLKHWLLATGGSMAGFELEICLAKKIPVLYIATSWETLLGVDK